MARKPPYRNNTLFGSVGTIDLCTLVSEGLKLITFRTVVLMKKQF